MRNGRLQSTVRILGDASFLLMFVVSPKAPSGTNPKGQYQKEVSTKIAQHNFQSNPMPPNGANVFRGGLESSKLHMGPAGLSGIGSRSIVVKEGARNTKRQQLLIEVQSFG